MALVIVGRNGRTGQVIIADSRAEGAQALFMCDPLTGGSAGAIAVPPETVTQEDAGGFPWLEMLGRQLTAADELATPKPFKLRVDTSGLPAGPALFQTDRFIARALDVAEEGVPEVHLDRDSAIKWGYVGRER